MEYVSRGNAGLGFPEAKTVPASRVVGEQSEDWSYVAGLLFGALVTVSGLGLLLIGLVG